MEGEAGPNRTPTGINAGDGGVKRSGPRSRTLRPFAAERAGEAIEQAKTAALRHKKPGGQTPCHGETDRDRDRGPRLWSKMKQPRQRDRGIGNLSEEFEADVDDGARRGRATG